MSYTEFEFIKNVADTCTDYDIYLMLVRFYNLGLTFFWFYIGTWVFDNIFIVFNKLYRKGSN